MPNVSVEPFRDRVEAGELLARKLADYRDRDDVVVLALPRGGVPVAREVARAHRRSGSQSIVDEDHDLVGQ